MLVEDFFYVCPTHLKDKYFCTPKIDEEALKAKREKALAEETEKLKKEYEERQRKKKEKQSKDKDKKDDKDGDKDKDKDKDKNAKDDKPDDENDVRGTPPQEGSTCDGLPAANLSKSPKTRSPMRQMRSLAYLN
jgi:hypothetical protein